MLESFYVEQKPRRKNQSPGQIVPGHMRQPFSMQFQFDEKIDKAIVKSVKSAQRFYRELIESSLEKGEMLQPPTYQDFASMAKGLMEATSLAEMDRLRAQSMKSLFEQTRGLKLLNYSAQKTLKDAYEALLRRL